jgi:hypothetical protein
VIASMSRVPTCQRRIREIVRAGTPTFPLRIWTARDSPRGKTSRLTSALVGAGMGLSPACSMALNDQQPTMSAA